MKSNKDLILDFIRESSQNNITRKFTTKEISQKFGMQRTNVSTILNLLVKEGKIEKISGRPVKYSFLVSLSDKKEESCFKKLIGHDGSLKKSIQLAKAVILYPEHELSVLISGESGTGKSFFASLMYEFAIENKIFNKDAPFVKFNCRYYDGLVDIYERLFGNEDSQNNCVFQKAKGGILFIDHIDLLPSNVCDKLFEIVENEKREYKDTMIICATNNNNLKKTLVEAYSAKFSVCIELPSLNRRKIEERLELAKKFFIKESLRMKKSIKINSELLRCILLYRCEHNVKQLMSDIKLGCANSYVRQFNKGLDELYIHIDDFPGYVKKGFLHYKNCEEQIAEIIPQNCSYTFSGENIEKVEYIDFFKSDAIENVYDFINKKVEELKNRGINDKYINIILSSDLQSYFRLLKRKMSGKNIDKNSISKIVDLRIVSMVDKFLNDASENFGRVYSESVFYGLCLHLSSTVERANRNPHLSNEQIMEIIQKHEQEYSLSSNFVHLIESEFEIKLPIDEIVFITMFILEDNLNEEENKKPVVLIASHGESTASSIAEVVNALVKNENTYSFDLSLSKDMSKAYDELKNIFLEIDNGKGILFLYDMGSLKTMAEMISQETGIKIRTINMSGTLLAIECSRKANVSENLDELFSTIKKYDFNFYNEYKRDKCKMKLIITLCMSGSGGAVQIKKYLENNLTLDGIEILPLAVSDKNVLIAEINRLKKIYEIQCVIGTYDPKLHGILFIPISKLFETPKDKLEIMLCLNGREQDEFSFKIDFNEIYNYLSESFNDFDINWLRKNLPKLINKIKKRVNGLVKDQELGLLLHIACSIYSIVNKEDIRKNPKRNLILNKNKRLYNDLKEFLIPFEEYYCINFSDDELANIISIVKK